MIAVLETNKKNDKKKKKQLIYNTNLKIFGLINK